MSTELLWFVSRATGILSMVLLTAVLVLGAVVSGRAAHSGTGRAVAMGVHRTLALGMTLFLAVHIVTAVADSYVDISWVAALVPFTSGYERLWVGLGTIALDLLVAVVATSLLRERMPLRWWRAVHWCTYALWPIALVHGFKMAGDDQPMLQLVTVACGVVGAIALAWRVARRPALTDTRRRHQVTAQEWA
ncbi:ferric reductase-like transmembrane domain-containing protein [Dermacoccaceae bacterium W4C1]